MDHSDSQTGSNLTMSTKVFKYNINTKNMSNKKNVGNAHKKKKLSFHCFVYILLLDYKDLFVKMF